MAISKFCSSYLEQNFRPVVKVYYNYLIHQDHLLRIYRKPLPVGCIIVPWPLCDDLPDISYVKASATTPQHC